MCPGKENEEILRVIPGTFQKASVRGVHFPDGWLEGFPYPGIELDEAGDKIEGYLFSSPDLYKHWGRLDAFEGPHYKRVQTQVLCEDGALILAFLYVINRSDIH